MAVVAVIGILTLIAFPGIFLPADASARSDARRLAGLIRYMDDASSSKKSYYRLMIGPDSVKDETSKDETSKDGVLFQPEGGGLRLEGSSVREISLNGAVVAPGAGASILFRPGAGAEPFSVRLNGSGRIFDIAYNPFSGKDKVSEKDF